MVSPVMWRSAERRSAQVRCLRSSVAPPPHAGAVVPGPCIVHKRGNDILHDPWYNKDMAFPMTEHDRLGLCGLLPPQVMSFEQQYERFINSFRSLEKNTRGEPDSLVIMAKWRILNRLHDRNETLYYRGGAEKVVISATSKDAPHVGSAASKDASSWIQFALLTVFALLAKTWMVLKKDGEIILTTLLRFVVGFSSSTEVLSLSFLENKLFFVIGHNTLFPLFIMICASPHQCFIFFPLFIVIVLAHTIFLSCPPIEKNY